MIISTSSDKGLMYCSFMNNQYMKMHNIVSRFNLIGGVRQGAGGFDQGGTGNGQTFQLL